jgi:hypothetical protein
VNGPVILTEGTFSLMKTPTPNPWGIMSGQCRESAENLGADWKDKRYVAGAGWYNKYGEYVGSGDLSLRDLFLLANEVLTGDEILIVLSEEDSFRCFIRGTEEHHRAFFKGNGLYATPPRWDKPGHGYLAERCVLIVAERKIFLAGDKISQVWTTLESPRFEVKARGEIRDLIYRMSKGQE